MNILSEIKLQKITKKTISEISLKYMQERFGVWCQSLEDDEKYNFYDHVYIISYFGNSLDPIVVMEEFRERNKNLIFTISSQRCGFYKFLPSQHCGVFFIDCNGSRHGYIQIMIGIHIHAVVVVHPEWRDEFERAFGRLKTITRTNSKNETYPVEIGDFSCNELFLEKVKPTESDALNVIGYCAKSVLQANGFYFGREDLFGFIGNAEATSNILVPIKKSKKITHHVDHRSLTGG